MLIRRKVRFLLGLFTFSLVICFLNVINSFHQCACDKPERRYQGFNEAVRTKSKASDEVKHDTNRNQGEQLNDQSVCTFRTAAYINDKKIALNHSPFLELTKRMACVLHDKMAVFGREFVVFQDVVLNPSKRKGTRKGGEKKEDVWGQPEKMEYFSLLPGYFSILCKSPPILKFDSKNHLTSWGRALGCLKNSTHFKEIGTDSYIKGLSLSIQRYEYANLYHTMTDFYNAFVLKLLFHTPPSRFNVIFVDAHPEGNLDVVWSQLFGRVYRTGQLSNPTRVEKLAWGMMGYNSPLNQHDRDKVPYLEEFREFFLSRYEVNTTHTIDCKHLNVVIIWRRDYVAHPRNKKGKVVRKFSNEDEILHVVNETFGPSANSVIGVQLDTLSMKNQLLLISACDILIGMHGAGLSHTLVLPKSSGLVELFPSYSSSLQHFQSMAKWRDIAYTRWQNSDATLEKGARETYVKPKVIRGLLKNIHHKVCVDSKNHDT